MPVHSMGPMNPARAELGRRSVRQFGILTGERHNRAVQFPGACVSVRLERVIEEGCHGCGRRAIRSATCDLAWGKVLNPVRSVRDDKNVANGTALVVSPSESVPAHPTGT
jgi:hypothetical protein